MLLEAPNNTHITFLEKDNIQLKDGDLNCHTLFLLKQSYQINFFESMPKIFTISTNDGSSKFNIDILKNTSLTIKNYLSQNPQNLRYHLDINDKNNVLGKYEQYYEGKSVLLNISDISLYMKIKNLLKIDQIPNLENQFVLDSFSANIEISKQSFYNYLQKKSPKEFTIITRRKEYLCNSFGVLSSKVISAEIAKNPFIKEYVYDIDDEHDEFQYFCDLFNFSKIKITQENKNILKEIGEDLKIECILQDIYKYENESEKLFAIIDDQQELIDETDDLFELLFKIKETTVPPVKNVIMDSIWSETEDNVKELAAFILQVINADLKLHHYLADLIISIDNEASEKSDLKILKPFIIKKLMEVFGSSKFNCSFIYNLYNKGAIPKEQIINAITKFDIYKYVFDNIYKWFLPEIIEIDNKSIINRYKSYQSAFYKLYLPNKIDKYKEMLTNGEPDDEITRALIHDDVDLFQSLILKAKINILNASVPFNIYDDFSNSKTNSINYINYAALHGSIKCFKYLLLNHVKLDSSSFENAIFGGNIEIIKIVDQNYNTEKENNITKYYNFRSNRPKIFKDVHSTIEMHRNDLFEWLIEQKYVNNNELKKNFIDFAMRSAICGNIQALIKLIYNEFDDYITSNIIQNAANNGFYRFSKVLYKLITKRIDEALLKKMSNFTKNVQCYISFANLSIFKIFINLVDRSNIESILNLSIVNNCLNIIQYIFEKIVNKDFSLSIKIICNSLETSLQNKNDDIFNYLFKQFKISCPDIFNTIIWTQKILPKVCKLGKFEIAKTLINEILDRKAKQKHSNSKNSENGLNGEMCTSSFYEAARSGSTNICKYFYDMKLDISYSFLISNYENLAKIKKEIFSLIFENSPDEYKNIFLENLLYPAIKFLNKDLVEYLLSKNAPCELALINSTLERDLDLVNIVLNHKSDPKFVNKKVKHGTALTIAAKFSENAIFKRLLLVPGIDPSLFDSKSKSSLQIALDNLNFDIIKSIIDFYGDNITKYPYELYYLVMRICSLFEENLNITSNLKEIFMKIANITNIDLNYCNKNTSFLNYACKYNDIEIASKMLSLKTTNTNLDNPTDGNTPLILAIIYDSKEIAKLLIKDSRTDLSIKNFNDQNALSIAVSKNREEIIKTLLNDEKFDPEENNINYIFYNSNHKITKLLITSKFIDVNYRPNINDPTKLQTVVETYKIHFQSSLLKLIELIINHPSFDKTKSQIKNILFNSIDNIKIFSRLIEVLGDEINDYRVDGLTLYDIAIKKDKAEILDAIVRHPSFSLKDRDIIADLINLFAHGNLYKTIPILIEYDKSHDHLIDFQKLLPNGKSFFTSISYHSFDENSIIKLFLDNGVDPNTPDAFDVYPLEHAIITNNKPLISALINSNKIDFSVKIPYKKDSSENKPKYETYLHLAARINDPTVLKKLLEKKEVDINSTNDLGETALMEACRYNIVDNIEELFKHDDLDYLKQNNNCLDAMDLMQYFNYKKFQFEKPTDRKKYLFNLTYSNVKTSKVQQNATITVSSSLNNNNNSNYQKTNINQEDQNKQQSSLSWNFGQNYIFQDNLLKNPFISDEQKQTDSNNPFQININSPGNSNKCNETNQQKIQAFSKWGNNNETFTANDQSPSGWTNSNNSFSEVMQSSPSWGVANDDFSGVAKPSSGWRNKSGFGNVQSTNWGSQNAPTWDNTNEKDSSKKQASMWGAPINTFAESSDQK